MGVPEASYGIAYLIATLLPFLFWLAVGLVCAFVAMNMAKKRDLSQVPAFFLGLFTGIIGLFIVALTPKKY